jgi:proteasome lid subunit RPN8/RPN11
MEIPSSAIVGAAEATIRNALREGRGRELCGFLVRDCRTGIARFYLAAAICTPEACLIRECEIERIKELVREHGEQILAFVHSHRANTTLSRQDRRSLNRGSLPWLIVCLRLGELQATLYQPQGS